MSGTTGYQRDLGNFQSKLSNPAAAAHSVFALTVAEVLSS